MGNNETGEARALEALTRWTSVDRHSEDEVWIESREVAAWDQQSNQTSLLL